MRVGAAIALVEMLMASAASAASLDEAASLYSRNQVAAAVEQYRTLAADTKADSATRSIAERELGRIAWLIDGDAPAALKHIAAARTLGGREACGAADMLARVLQESGRNEQVLKHEPDLLSACSDPGRKDAIRVRLIKARLDLAAAHPDRRKPLLEQAAAEAAQLTDDAGVEGARMRLETALLTDQPQAGLRFVGQAHAPGAGFEVGQALHRAETQAVQTGVAGAVQPHAGAAFPVGPCQTTRGSRVRPFAHARGQPASADAQHQVRPTAERRGHRAPVVEAVREVLA